MTPIIVVNYCKQLFTSERPWDMTSAASYSGGNNYIASPLVKIMLFEEKEIQNLPNYETHMQLKHLLNLMYLCCGIAAINLSIYVIRLLPESISHFQELIDSFLKRYHGNYMLAAVAFLMRCGNTKLVVPPNVDEDNNDDNDASNDNRETDIGNSSGNDIGNGTGSDNYNDAEGSNDSDDSNSDNDDTNGDTSAGAVTTFEDETDQRDDNDEIDNNLTAGNNNINNGDEASKTGEAIKEIDNLYLPINDGCIGGSETPIGYEKIDYNDNTSGTDDNGDQEEIIESEDTGETIGLTVNFYLPINVDYIDDDDETPGEQENTDQDNDTGEQAGNLYLIFNDDNISDRINNDNIDITANNGQEEDEGNAEDISDAGHDSSGNNENFDETNKGTTNVSCPVNANAGAEDNTGVDNAARNDGNTSAEDAISFKGVTSAQDDDGVDSDNNSNRNSNESNNNEVASNKSSFKESGENGSNKNNSSFDNKSNASGSSKTISKDNGSKQDINENKRTDSGNTEESIEEAGSYSSSNELKSEGKRRYNDRKPESNDEEHRKILQKGCHGHNTENSKNSSNNPNSSSSQQSKNKDSPTFLESSSPSDSIDSGLLPPTRFFKPLNAASPSGTYVSTTGTMSAFSSSTASISQTKNHQDASNTIFHILRSKSSGSSTSSSVSKGKAKIIISPGLAVTLVTRNVQFSDSSESHHTSSSSLAYLPTVRPPSSTDAYPSIRFGSVSVEPPTNARPETSDENTSSTRHTDFF